MNGKKQMACEKCGRTVYHRLTKSKNPERRERDLQDWTPYRHSREYRRGNEMNTRFCGE